MLEQKDSGTIGSVADFLAKELQIGQGSKGEYISLKDRLAEFVEEPDKAAGFTFVGNDTWLPKHLVSARKQQQCRVSRAAKNGIVWTR